MAMTKMLSAAALIAGTIICSKSYAQTGIAAFFGPTQAVEGKDFEIRLDVTDKLKLVQSVIVFIQIPEETEPRKYLARPTGKESHPPHQTWLATVPAQDLPSAPATIKFSAQLLTKRGGLVLTLGEPEAFETPIMSPSRARQENVAFQRLNRELRGEFPFVGGIGIDGKAATAARVRAVLSGSGKFIGRWDLSIKVLVGPTFLVPAKLKTNAPLVLGFEMSGRRPVASRFRLGFDIFSEIYSSIDLGLPGLDAHAGIRFGTSFALAGSARLDIALGGGGAWYRINEAEEIWGFSGGLQSIFWFGDTDTRAKEK